MSNDVYVIIEHLGGEVEDISFVALAAARVIADATGGDVVAVVLGGSGPAATLAADRIVVVEDPLLADYNPEAYIETLQGVIGGDPPRAVVAGDTSMGSEVAGMLSGRLGHPLVSKCLSVSATGAEIGFTAQICGGKILVEGELPSPTALLTMVPGGFSADDGRSDAGPEPEVVAAPSLEGLRVRLLGFIEPEVGDVDITRETVLIGVGRGIEREDTLELAEELAAAIGGAVCASRPVVDQGWLATSRLVGKSGMRVKPTAYLAFGISGAPEHVEGMTDSDVVIAVNTDPTAPIFDVAHYGAEMDLIDLLPVLTEQVLAAKGD
jgi:electron transfer flavoprotein alpha subunit